MALGQEKLHLAMANKLRTDTAATIGLVALTQHDASSPTKYRIMRDRPPIKGKLPFLGIRINQSKPLVEEGPTHVQDATVHFISYATTDLTAMKIADRLEHLLHARDEQIIDGTNRGYYEFTDSNISNRVTRYKTRDLPIFDDETDTWSVLIEALVIWVDESCG